MSQQIRRLVRKKALAGVPDELKVFLDEAGPQSTQNP
jgi:hypothetical protein